MEPLKLFYSYAHKDKTLRDELGAHLANCRQLRIIQDWYDAEIIPGKDWDATIKEKLRTADFILCLLSSDFLNSKYISLVELPEAFERRAAAKVEIVPIFIRDCDYSGSFFEHVQRLPPGDKPVTMWPNQDEAWTKVVKGLKTAFEEFRKASNASNGAATSEATKLASSVSPASTATAQAGSGANAPQQENRALAAASTKAFQGLKQLMANPKIKAFVTTEEDKLVAADEALQTLVDYKNVHDRLHDLQFKCYNYVFQESRKLEEQIDWPLLDKPRKDLAGIIDALQQAAEQTSLAKDEDFTWLDVLRDAASTLEQACNDLSMVPLHTAGRSMRAILETRPAIFDAKLSAAAKTLPLQELREALSAIRAKVNQINPSALTSEAGKRFTAGVDALPRLSANLHALAAEHTRWQGIATTFWSLDALIEKTPDPLRTAWPRLRERLERICGDRSTPLARAIVESANKLEQLLAIPAPSESSDLQRWRIKVRQTYTSCSNDAGTRFYQVDFSLKRLCDELRDLQMALAGVLEDLP
jgi:hypothetical protein